MPEHAFLRLLQDITFTDCYRDLGFIFSTLVLRAEMVDGAKITQNTNYHMMLPSKINIVSTPDSL